MILQPKKLTSRRHKYDRINYLVIFIFIFSLVVVLRLFDLQVLKHPFYTALAEGQHAISEKLVPERGEIYVREKDNPDQLIPIAVNRQLHLLYANPKEIEQPEEVLKKIIPILEIAEDDEEKKSQILAQLSKEDDIYEPIAHELSDEAAEAIKKLEQKGLGLAEEDSRYYPEGNLYSHLTGFLGWLDDARKGQYGLEGYFEEALAGRGGFLKTERDDAGNWITVGQTLIEEKVDGDDLVLTIEPVIQYTACTKLAEAVQKHGADQGSVIIMNPETGAILALCNYPDFDPNKYQEVENIEVYKNQAIFGEYEPGSVNKSISMSIALDLGLISPQTTYTDEGFVKIGKYTIKNFDGRAYGVQTMTNVLENSLNTGAIFAVRLAGNAALYKYFNNYGYGEKTGLTLEAEADGDISTLASEKDIYAATASYGQGFTLTPIQLITAYAAIANGGKLVKPYVVDEIKKPNGFTEKTETEVKRQVISEITANTLSAMLASVVKNGHAKRAQVPGYFVAGKTGTAQIPKRNGVGYESGVHKDTFVGFAPVDSPAFIMLVKMDNPRDVSWAEGSVVPLFGDIAKFLLAYLEVPPEINE